MGRRTLARSWDSKVNHPENISYRSLRMESLERRELLSAAPWEVGGADLAGFYSFENGAESEVGEIAGVCYGDALTQYSEVLQSGVLNLDGDGDYVGLGNPAEMNFSGQITLSAWVKADAANGIRNIIAHGNTTNPNAEVFLRINGNHYEIGSWNGSDHLARAVMSAGDIGTWVHLAGTYDGTAWHLYRNGVEIASQTAAVGAIPVNSNWCIGAAGDGTQRFFRGGVDDVKIFDKALSQTELEELTAPREILMPTSVEGWSCVPSDAGILYGVNGNVDGELQNGARFTEDSVRGGALDFANNNGYVTLGDAESMQITGEITLSAWVKPNSTNGTQDIISKGFTSDPNAEIVLRINNGQYEIGSWDGANHFASAAIPTEDVGAWVHLLGTYDGTAWKLFRNGELVATRTDSVGAISVNAGWVIGASAAALTGNTSARYFDGQITDIQVFNTQVTALQAAAFAASAEKVAPKPVELRPVTIGGEAYALCNSGTPYQLFLDSNGQFNENLKIHWEVHWGDSNVEHYTSAALKSVASHNYAKPGAYTITVTAKVGGKNIPMVLNTISIQAVETGNLIQNGDFEEMPIPTGHPWWIFNNNQTILDEAGNVVSHNELDGWSGLIEIQSGQYAELDADSHQQNEFHPSLEACGSRTAITSDPFHLIPGEEYTLTFRSWNRSDYAEDNMVSVTVPGSITKINGQTVSSLLSLMAEEASKPKWENLYSCLKIDGSTVTYSAGGMTYREETGDNEYVNHTASEPNYHVSSITFTAPLSNASTIIGTVTFSDVSTDDVVPSYGPFIDDISIPAKYAVADIDVDSNNDGTIDAYDDPVETISFGQVVGAGTTFSVHVEPNANFTMDSSRYGARIKSSNQAVVATATDGKLLTLGTGNVEFLSGTTPGTTTLTYEVYEKSTGTVLASDSVLVTIGNWVGVDCAKNNIHESSRKGNLTNLIVSLTAAPAESVTVTYVVGGAAKYGLDYTLTLPSNVTFVQSGTGGSGTITFDTSGDLNKIFTVTAKQDSLIEKLLENITFTIALDDNPGGIYAIAQDRESVEVKIEDMDTLELQSVQFSNNLTNFRSDPDSSGTSFSWTNGGHWEIGKKLSDNPATGYVPVAYSSDDMLSVKNAMWYGKADETIANNLYIQFDVIINGIIRTTSTIKLINDDLILPIPGEEEVEASENTWILSENISLTETFADLFGISQAKYEPEFKLTWKLVVEESVPNLNGDEGSGTSVSELSDQRNAGESTSCLYITYQKPETESLYHSIIHIGCVAAMRVKSGSEQDVFDAIWTKFASRNIRKVKIENGRVIPDAMLTYYGQEVVKPDISQLPENIDNWTEEDYELNNLSNEYNRIIAGILPIPSDGDYDQKATVARQYAGNSVNTFTTRGLLAKTDATCGGWQSFALDVLKSQGINAKGYTISRIPLGEDLFLTGNTSLISGSEISSTYSERFKINPDIVGQGGGKPMENTWVNHAVIYYNNSIYDPSYGISYGMISNAKTTFLSYVHSIGERKPAIGTQAEVLGYTSIYEPLKSSCDVTVNDFWFYSDTGEDWNTL